LTSRLVMRASIDMVLLSIGRVMALIQIDHLPSRP